MEDSMMEESTTGGGSASARTKVPPGQFAPDIQLMMHGFGDVAKPLMESALLVEKIVRRQLVMLVDAAATVALRRCSRSIGIEEFLFLFRRDKDKLHRLLHYLKSKDIKSMATRDMDEVPESLDDLKEGGRWKGGKRTKLSRQFLATIDPSDELASLVDRPGLDAVRLGRMQRADVASRKMDVLQYVHFNQARCTNFGRDAARMRDWLAECTSGHSAPGGSEETTPKLSQGGFELVAYIVYETVAQIVDLALLVKQDKRLDVDPLARLTPLHCLGTLDAIGPPQSGVAGGSMASAPASAASSAQFAADQLDAATTQQQQQRGSSPAVAAGSGPSSGAGSAASSAAASIALGRKRRLNETDSAIQPHEIREAMRRYQHDSAWHFASPLGVRSSAVAAMSTVL